MQISHTARDKSFSNPFFSCVTVWHAGSCSRYSQQTMQINFSRVEQFKLPAEGFVTNDPRIGWPMVNDHSVFAIYYSLSSTQYLKDLSKTFLYSSEMTRASNMKAIPYHFRVAWRSQFFSITTIEWLHGQTRYSPLQQFWRNLPKSADTTCQTASPGYGKGSREPFSPIIATKSL